MTDWKVRSGDEFLMLHAKTGLFAGKPQTGWSPSKNRYDLFVTATNDQSLYQPIRIRAVNHADKGFIDTSSIFELVTQHDETNYTLHTPAFAAGELVDAPPLRITLVDNEPATSLHIDWNFVPASEDQLRRGDLFLYYGMPVHVVKTTGRRYLRLDTWQKWLAAYHMPVTDAEMDSWILMPTRGLHVCLNAQAKQCHHLYGTAVSHSMMRCKFEEKGQVKCYDDEGDPVHGTADECAALCRTKSYKCSGAPLYQCQLEYVAAPFADYDTCSVNCLNPQLQARLRRVTRQPVVAATATTTTTTTDGFAWVLWAVTAVVVLVVLFTAVYVMARQKRTVLH